MSEQTGLETNKGSLEKLDIGALKVPEKVVTKVSRIVECKLIEYGQGIKKGFLVGTLTDGTNMIAFKYWDEAKARELAAANIAGYVVVVSGETETYKGNKEFKVTELLTHESLQTVENKKSFLPQVQGKAEKYKEFLGIANKELSQNGLKVLTSVLTPERLNKFKEEMAGTKMHDAKMGGLLNHTLKMLKYTCLMIEMEPRIQTVEHMKDLMILGVILHDIGKIQEYDAGVRAENSFVTHRVFGIEYLHAQKEIIVGLYDEKFYYQLQDVIIGHHGEFGNPPNTVAAYIIHLIDMLESQVTGIFDRVENGEVKSEGGATVVNANRKNLVI